MPDQIDNLEREAEDLLAGLAAEIDLPAAPPPAVIARVKAAVRHELNERWLATQAAPAPSQAAIQRVRKAVHQELAATAPPKFAIFKQPWLGALAAAAVIALGVGLVRQIGYLQPPGAADDIRPPLQLAETQVDLFVESAQVAMAHDSFSESVLLELEEIDARLAGSAQGSSQESVLDQLDGAIKDVFETPQPSDRTMRNLPTRALG